MNPRGANQPSVDPDLHPLQDPGGSLVESLGAVADDLRQIATDLGLRPYRVFSVTYRWTGGAPGMGEAQVVSQQELLPTPKLGLDGVGKELRAGGLVERGTVTLTQVSPRYTEQQIGSLFADGRQLGREFQTFVEVVMDRRDGDGQPRRRFVVAGVPSRDPDSFQWVVRLLRQDAQRLPDGQPNPVLATLDDQLAWELRRP